MLETLSPMALPSGAGDKECLPETLLQALSKDSLHTHVPASVGEFVAALHESTILQGDRDDRDHSGRAESDALDELESMVSSDSAFYDDASLLEALDSLAAALDESPPCRTHGNLSAESIRVALRGSSDWRPTVSIDSVGSAAVDVGSLLASLLLLAVARSHAEDAPPPAEPTWPPTPLSSLSAVHGAAQSFWQHYLSSRKAAVQADDCTLLCLCVGFAGIKMLTQVMMRLPAPASVQ